jgi:hypothetical protein
MASSTEAHQVFCDIELRCVGVPTKDDMVFVGPGNRLTPFTEDASRLQEAIH